MAMEGTSMATQDYLKQAVSMMQQAVASKQAEIDDVRRTITQYEQEENARKDDIRKMTIMRQQEASNAEDTNTTAAYQIDIQKLQVEEAQINSDYARKIRDAQALIVDKQRSLDAINQAINQVQRVQAGA
jgi:hypothetical protein